VTKYKDETRGKRYDLRIRLNPEERRDPDDLSKLYVRSRDGRLVELRNLVRVQEGAGRASSAASIASGRSPFSRASRGCPWGKRWKGSTASQPRSCLPTISRNTGAGGYDGGIIRISDVRHHPRVIMAYMSLPPVREFCPSLHRASGHAALVYRGLGALLLTGNTISIFSFIGLILLMGLSKKMRSYWSTTQMFCGNGVCPAGRRSSRPDRSGCGRS